MRLPTGLLAITVLTSSVCRAEGDFVTMRVSREAMGTEFEVLVSGFEEQSLVDAANEALDEVEALDGQLSLYRDRSELSSINRRASSQYVRVEPRLLDLLELAGRISTESEGAFDITVAPLIECWGFFRGEGRLPTAESIAAVLQSVGMRHVELQSVERTVHFRRPGVRLDLGGIAKGYAVDRAVEVLRDRGITRALVHGGKSSVYALGAPPGEDAWTLGIRHPQDESRRVAVVRLRDRALSTSGNYEKFFEVDGTLYSHIIDPRTGWPARGMLSASALSPTAAESDALATAFFVMGVEKTRRYCAAHPDIEAVLVPEPRGGEPVAAVRVGNEEYDRTEQPQS